MQNQTPNDRPPQQLNHQIQGQQEGDQQTTPAMKTRGPQNNPRIRYSTPTNLPMYSPSLVQHMYIQAATGQPRIPTYTYSQTGPVTAQHAAVQQPGQTTHVIHAPHQQYYKVNPQFITMNNGIPQGPTHPQTAYYHQGSSGTPVAYQVPRLQIGASQMSYSAQQSVHISQIGQGTVNQQVHRMTQQTQKQQQHAAQQQQQQQHQSQVQAIPQHQQQYRHPVEPNVGQAHRGSSEGGPQGGGGDNVGHTGGSGQPKEIPPIVVRRKKILAIIDAASGKNVIDTSESTGPSATAETVKEDDKAKSETPEVSVATPKLSSVASGIVRSWTGDSLINSTKDATPSQTAATDDSSSKTKVIKTEFCNKISQANDGLLLTPRVIAKAPQTITTSTRMTIGSKKIIKYDRDQLLQLRQRPASRRKINDIDIVDILRVSRPTKNQANVDHCLGTGALSIKPLLQTVTPLRLTTAPSDDDLTNLMILKKARRILYRLSEANFDESCKKFLELPLHDRTPGQFVTIAQLIMDKVMDEPDLSRVCARFVQHFYVHATAQLSDSARLLRKEVVDECQKAVGSRVQDEELFKLGVHSKMEMEDMRRRNLASVQFMGELYNLDLLTTQIVVNCVKMWIANQDENDYLRLCKLLTTAGQKLRTNCEALQRQSEEAKQSSPPLPKFVVEVGFVDNILTELRLLSLSAKMSTKTRLTIHNLLTEFGPLGHPKNNPKATEIHMYTDQAPMPVVVVAAAAVGSSKVPAVTRKLMPESIPLPIGRPTTSAASEGILNLNAMASSSKKNTLDTKVVAESSKSNNFLTNSHVMFENLGFKDERTKTREQNESSSISKNPATPTVVSCGSASEKECEKYIVPSGLSTVKKSDNPNILAAPNTRGAVAMQKIGTNFVNCEKNENSTSHSPLNDTIKMNNNSNSEYRKAVDVISTHQTPSSESSELVRDIFRVFVATKRIKFVEVLMADQLKDKTVVQFVEILVRQVGQMSTEDELCLAAKLIKLFVQKESISMAEVLKIICSKMIPVLIVLEGVYEHTKFFNFCLPTFLLEMFGDEQTFAWLIELARPLAKNFKSVEEKFLRLILLHYSKTKGGRNWKNDVNPVLRKFLPN